MATESTESKHLAQFNVARLHHPVDAPENSEFVAAMGPINELAEASPGFVWRLTDPDGQSSTYVRVSDDPNEAINLSVWETPEDLKAFVYRSAHVDYLRRKVDWFEPPSERHHQVCWWVPAGHRPSIDEAFERLRRLQSEGPSDDVFPLAVARSESSDQAP